MIAMLQAQFSDVLAIVAGHDFVIIGGHGRVRSVIYRVASEPAHIDIDIVSVTVLS